MFRKLTVIGALALALAAQTATAQSATPAGEALIDRFMLVIPGADRIEQADLAPDPVEIERLTGLNPDHGDDVREVLAEFARCSAPARVQLRESGLRMVARQLGDEKLGRLIAFYESEDMARFDALMARTSQGETLSAGDQAELERIMTAYPLTEFAEAFNPFNPALWQEVPLAEITRCENSRDEAFARLGLRLLSDEEMAMQAAWEDSAEPAAGE